MSYVTLQPSDSTPINVSKIFWRYAIPAVAAMLVNGVYQIVDGIFIGQYTGHEGLAGINMAWPIIYVVAGLGLMVGMGSGSLMSINRGEKGSEQQKNNILLHGVAMITVLGLLSTLLLMIMGDTLLLLQGAKQQNFTMASAYLSPFIWAAPITLFASALPFLIRNDESPKIATWFMIAGAVINIGLDYLLIGVYNLGLQGAAYATIVAQATVCILGIGYFIEKNRDFYRRYWHLKIEIKQMKQIALLGSSSLVMYLYTSFVFALHNRLFMEYGDSVTVGAFAIVGYLMVIYYLIAEGLGEGIQPPVSYFHGANQQAQIAQLMGLATKITVGIGIFWVVLLNLLPETMIALFNSQDSALIGHAVTGIRWHLSAMFLDGFIVLATMYFMSINQGAKALTLSIGNMLIQVPFLIILPYFLGVKGVWLALPVSNIVLTLIVAPMVWRQLNSTKVAVRLTKVRS